MAADEVPLTRLVEELGLTPVDPTTAVGELCSVPTAVTLLNAEPLALMAQFRVAPHGREVEPILGLLTGVPEEQAGLTIENGSAWLSLYDLRGQTGESIRQLLEHVATTIQSTDLATPAGCLRCGGEEEARLMFVAGRPTRLCPECLNEAVAERHQTEADLNRSRLSATIGLPAVVAIAAAGWAVFWTLLEMLLDWADVKVVEINEVTVMLGIGLFAGVGYGLGRPLGTTLRRSLGNWKGAIVPSLLLVLAGVASGEVLYVALLMVRMLGVFDLQAAAQWVGQVIAGYTVFWIACKLLLAAAIAGFCVAFASERTTARLDV